MHSIIGNDMMTINDLALFPFIEMLNAIVDIAPLGESLM